MKKILFTGGGSAGHTVPNLALIEDVLSFGDTEVCYIGTDGIEKGLVTKRGIPYYTITCPKLVRGKEGWRKNAHIPMAFLRAVREAKAGLLTFRPDVVFSKGGYVALPVVFAARSLKIPCIAHESDFSPGLANRISARRCQTVFTSFPETAKRLRHGKYSGAPMRASLTKYTKADAIKALSIPLGAKVLLVLGGGSGSRTLNEAVLSNLKALTSKYYVLHICGKGNLPVANFRGYRAFEYFSDIGLLYAVADGVVSRAGAGAVFELLALQKPALFIPLAGATRGDQAENAEYFRSRGLCRVLAQNEIEKLPQAVDELFLDTELKKRLKENALVSGNAVIVRALREQT